MRIQLIRPIAAAALVLALVGAGPAALAGKAGEVRVQAFELLNEGVSAFNRGDFNLAIEKLGKCSSIALSSFRAHYYLGRAMSGARRYDEALEALEIALDLDPEALLGLVAAGDAYLKLGRIEESWAEYTKALKLRPAFAPALDGMARSFDARANDARAISFFQQAIASDRGYAPAYTNLGNLYLRLDRLKEAVELLEEAVTIRSDYAPGLNSLGRAYARLGLGNEAVATVQRAIELEPRNPEHPLALGWLQLEQGLINQSETSFYHALELGLPQARGGLAEVARRRGAYDVALEEIEAALAAATIDPLAVNRLEEQRRAVTEERAEVEALTGSLTTGEATPEAHARLALILSRRGQWDRAIELQRGGPATDEHRERLAYMLFQAGRYRESGDHYAALAGAGQRTEARINHGVALARLGDDDAAAEAFTAVLESAPDNRLARLYLGNALLRMGERRTAAEAYRQVLEHGRNDEIAERVRRILKQIAPDLLPEEPPVPPPPPESEDELEGIGS